MKIQEWIEKVFGLNDLDRTIKVANTQLEQIEAARPDTPKCTYCGGNDFFEGPSGGSAVNILCANPTCRHWFNHSVFGLDDLKRIEPTEEQKQTEDQRRKAQQAEKDQGFFDEGKLMYERGLSPLACIQDSRHERRMTYVQWEDIIRLCGWMKAVDDHYGR